MRYLTFALALIGALATFTASVPSQAQLPDWQAVPRYETFNLTAGFQPDPQFINVEAGGNGWADMGPGCAGYIDFSKPDVDLNYNAGQYQLSFWAEGPGDLTLVVYDPAHQWICNDDYSGLNPGIQINNPQSGNYNIWVGSHQGIQPARLYITEKNPFTR